MWRKFFDRRRSVLRFRVSSVQWSNIIVLFSASIISSQMMWKLPFKWFPIKGFYVPRMTRCDWRHPRKNFDIGLAGCWSHFSPFFRNIMLSVPVAWCLSSRGYMRTGFCLRQLLNISVGRKIPLITRHYICVEPHRIAWLFQAFFKWRLISWIFPSFS